MRDFESVTRTSKPTKDEAYELALAAHDTYQITAEQIEMLVRYFEPKQASKPRSLDHYLGSIALVNGVRYYLKGIIHRGCHSYASDGHTLVRIKHDKPVGEAFVTSPKWSAVKLQTQSKDLEKCQRDLCVTMDNFFTHPKPTALTLADAVNTPAQDHKSPPLVRWVDDKGETIIAVQYQYLDRVLAGVAESSHIKLATDGNQLRLDYHPIGGTLEASAIIMAIMT